MTIAYDNATFNSTATDASFSHTITGSADNPALLVFTLLQNGTQTLGTVSYAGTEMPQAGVADVGFCFVYAHYLTNPPVGANTVSVTQTQGSLRVIAASYTGVDPQNPIRSVFTDDGGGNATSITLTDALSGDLQVAAGGTREDTSGLGSITWSNSETERLENGDSGTGARIAVADLDPDTGTTMGFDDPNDDYTALIGFALVPASAGKTRAIKYFYDINDPRGIIRDELGRVVPPWQVQANNWIRVSGIFLPTSKKYASFTQDPELAYIEEVQYSVRGGLRIKTSRGELTEVLFARAASGKTL